MHEAEIRQWAIQKLFDEGNNINSTETLIKADNLVNFIMMGNIMPKDVFPGETDELGRKEVPDLKRTQDAINTLVQSCHARSWNAGWWHDLETGKPIKRNFGEICTLIHSEISEAYEGYRKNLRDDHLPEYPMPAVELFDALIRICDAIGGLYPDCVCAGTDKLSYNDSRADHKPEARKKSNGKKT